MCKLIDLVGQRFGRLTVIEKVKSNDKNSRWLCQCDCGNNVSISRVHLMNGHVQSCGCYRKEVAAENSHVLKMKHGLSEVKLYGVWANMKYRCYNPHCKAYKDYGGRGISVCPEWLSGFTGFYSWAIGAGYKEGLSIDRINNDGNYEPSNCRWVTMKIQSANRRNSSLYTFNGKTQGLKQWADEYGMHYGTLSGRVKELGMPLSKALAQPLRRALNG